MTTCTNLYTHALTYSVTVKLTKYSFYKGGDEWEPMMTFYTDIKVKILFQVFINWQGIKGILS